MTSLACNAARKGRYLIRKEVPCNWNIPMVMSPFATKALDNLICKRNLSSTNKNGEFPETFLQENVPTEGEWANCSRKFMAPLQVPVRGGEILTNPLFNKGTAFKSGERDRLRFRKFMDEKMCID